MRALAAVTIAVLSLPGAAAEAVKNPELEKAQKALAAKKYPDALKLLEAAEKKGGLDLDAYSTLLESKALCLASLKKVDEAEADFRRLLALDPRRDLAGKYKGDVERALNGALEWVKQNGGLQVVALEPGSQGDKVKQVSVAIKNDPLKMAKSVRIYLKQDGGTWKPVDAALNNQTATADTDSSEVEFWVEVLGEKKDQLKFLGSAIRPVKQRAAVVAEAPKPKEDTSKPNAASPKPSVSADSPRQDETAKLAPVAAQPSATLTDEAPKKGSMLRPVSYVLLGASVVAAGVGVYFGATSAGARSQIRLDQMAGTFSQQQLYDRDQAAIGQAKVANGLFISAAIVAAIGVVLFVLG